MPESSKSWFDKVYWPVTILLVILTVWLFLPGGASQPDNVGTFASSTAEYAGSTVTNSCVDHDNYDMHYHFDLEVYVNDTKVTIPSSIGTGDSDCMRPMHTHDPSGHVHIELADGYNGNTPTLHDFFQIWGYELNNTSLLDNIGTVSLTLNEESVDLSNKNPAGYRPADGDTIILSI